MNNYMLIIALKYSEKYLHSICNHLEKQGGDKISFRKSISKNKKYMVFLEKYNFRITSNFHDIRMLIVSIKC